MKVIRKTGEMTCNWNNFVSWANIGHYIFLMLFNQSLVLVDKSTVTDEEIKELYNLLQQKIKVII